MRAVLECCQSGKQYARWQHARRQRISCGQRSYAPWAGMFQAVHENKAGSCWGYQWRFTARRRPMLPLMPNANRVSNDGFGSRATHTMEVGRFSGLPAGQMEFPKRRPEAVQCDSAINRYTASALLASPLVRRVRRMLFRWHWRG